MIGEAIDRMCGLFSPSWGMNRVHARATMQQMLGMSSSSGAGYAAGKLNRLTKNRRPTIANENSIPRENIERCRALSYQLYRDNPHARKICRQLESKVIGRGMLPASQATLPNGDEHTEFRLMARTIWSKRLKTLDYRGIAGKGGQHFTELAKTALRATILGGEVLYRLRIDGKDTKAPTRIQLIAADRLSKIASPDHDMKTNLFFFGIETNSEDRRIAYHILKFHPSDPRGVGTTDIVRVPADEMGHVFVQDDIDQFRGSPWFSAALLKMQDTGDYEFNELKAAAVSACVVLGYRRSPGQSQFGFNQPEDSPLTDADGNKITAMQPGMLIDMGRTGEIQGFNPQRPNSNAGEFIQHLLRSQAASVAGIKSSSMTMNYAGSSFSSEKSADNDAWPELEGVQDWFSRTFYQPVYENVIVEAVIANMFEGIVRKEEFLERKDEYLEAVWQGPVPRSINPTDDAKAARMRIQNGQSSPQLEASSLGRNWREIVSDIAEFIDYCESKDLPDSLTAQMLGIDQVDDPLENAENVEDKESTT